ncbi:MAG: AAA family ATPase, partial [Bacilli bacterium]
MAIKFISISGLRGFSTKTLIKFAVPDNETLGSGLTVLVGPNNSGKSTVIEAVHLLNSHINVIPISSRNMKINGKVEIIIEDVIGNKFSLETTENKGAFIKRKFNNQIIDYSFNNLNSFILSSKRGFNSTFSNNIYQDRNNYKGNTQDSDYRNENNINSNFGGRLLTICNNREKFDSCLKKVLFPVPIWTIEGSDNNSLYLEFSFNNIRHSSKGAGDGYINIFNIVDSLYDSSEDNVILIDEPEISLHPDLQKKLFKLLIEYSKDKQIIISTHSPYFVNWELFSMNSKIIRFKKDRDEIKIFELCEKTKKGIYSLIHDAHNPHILSTNANEIFFLNDNVILTEGQDDVLCYSKIFEQYKFNTMASFFGWGAGGASKIENVLDILNDLGYKKVFIILDNDKKDMIISLSIKYKNYKIYAIPTNDVRNKNIDKRANNIIKSIENIDMDKNNKDEIIKIVNDNFPKIEGIVNSMSNYSVNKKYEEDILLLIDSIKEYFDTDCDYPISYNIENQYNDNIDDNKKIAHLLLEKFLLENKVYDYIKNKYNKFEFKSGGGGELSFKQINKNEYYIIIEQTNSISEKQSITINFHII